MQNYCKAFANKEFEFAFALQFLKGKKKGQEELKIAKSSFIRS